MRLKNSSMAPKCDGGAAPTISDGPVTLRPHTLADVPGMVEMGSDPETARWTTVPQPYEPRHAQQWVTEKAPDAWRRGTALRWAITLDGRFAGNLDIRLARPPDIGYALAPWARGQGVMARAVRLATRWAFTERALPVIHWSTHAGNLVSWRVAHACGFTFHGERPLSIPRHDALCDGWFASLRPGDDPHPRTTWWSTPVLDGARVRLRPSADTDVPRIVEACTDPRTRHWLPHLPLPYTPGTAQRFVRDCGLGASRGESVNWVVTGVDDDRLLGNIAVFGLAGPYDSSGGEVGYWTHPDARGRGVMREALDLVLAHAFAPREQGGLGRHRLMIGAAWDNTASRHVAERAGFTLVGRHRMDGVLGDGTMTDGAWYDRLATDPR